MTALQYDLARRHALNMSVLLASSMSAAPVYSASSAEPTAHLRVDRVANLRAAMSARKHARARLKTTTERSKVWKLTWPIDAEEFLRVADARSRKRGADIAPFFQVVNDGFPDRRLGGEESGVPEEVQAMPRSTDSHVGAVRALEEANRRAHVPRRDGLLVAALGAGDLVQVTDEAQNDDVGFFALETVDRAQEDLRAQALLPGLRLEDVLESGRGTGLGRVLILLGFEVTEIALVQDSSDTDRFEKTSKDPKLTEVRRQDTDAGAGTLQSEMPDEVDNPLRFCRVRMRRVERARAILLETVVHEEDVPTHALHVRVLEDAGGILQLGVKRVPNELADLGSHAPLGLENRHRNRKLREAFEQRDVMAMDLSARRIDRLRIRCDTRAELKVVADADEVLHRRDQIRYDLRLEALSRLLDEDDRRTNLLDYVENIGTAVRRGADHARAVEEDQLFLVVECAELVVDLGQVATQGVQLGRLFGDDRSCVVFDEACALGAAEQPDVGVDQKISDRAIGPRLSLVLLALLVSHSFVVIVVVVIVEVGSDGHRFQNAELFTKDPGIALVRVFIRVVERESRKAVGECDLVLHRGRLVLTTTHLDSLGIPQLGVALARIQVGSVAPEGEEFVRSCGPLNPAGTPSDRVPAFLRIDCLHDGAREAVVEGLHEVIALEPETVDHMLPLDLTRRALRDGAKPLDVLLDIFALLEFLANLVAACTSELRLAKAEQAKERNLAGNGVFLSSPSTRPADDSRVSDSLLAASRLPSAIRTGRCLS